MIRLLLSIVCLIACGVPAAAQWSSGSCPGGVCPLQIAPQQPATGARELAAVVRVSNRLGNSQSLGSGTLVDKNDEHGLIVTCGHLFDDGTGTVVVQFTDGKSYCAKVLEVERAWDLAALLIVAPSAEPLPIVDAPPRVGTPLESCGYGPNGRLLRNRGQMLRAVTAQGTTTPESFELSGSARQGDSGGPVLDSQLRLVGVLFGTNGQVVAATGCGPMRRFLARHSQRFHNATPHQANRPHVDSPREGNKSPESDTKTVDRLGVVEQAIGKLEDRLSDAREHWNKAESTLSAQQKSLGAWHDRVQSVEERLGELAERCDVDRLTAIVRDVVHGLPIAGDSGVQPTGLWSIVWPVLAGALGLSTPPTAAFVVWKLLGLLIRGKRRKSSAESSKAISKVRTSANLLNDDYARQLVEVFGHSGRSPIQDATLGREYDEELRRAEESSDGALAKLAKSLRDRVETRFHRIHGQNPSPAEPVEQGPGKHI